MKKRIKIDVYHTSFTVFILDQLTDLYNYFPELQNQVTLINHGAVTFTKEHKSGQIEYYIAFAQNELSVGLIAHESVHLVSMIFKNIGVLLSYENDEPQAYLVQFICEKIYQLTNERKK